MKKLITKIAIFSIGLTFFANTAKAQLADGSIAPDFSAKDINGNTQHLYTYLNQGKTVFIDIFAIWCNPCWNFHENHCLDSMWQYHGPTGMTGVNSSTTNDVMIFMVEGDTTTSTACLYDSAAPACTGGPSQGNWVTGTNYPILDKAYIANLYQITYFPTLFMICPDRTVRCVSPSTVLTPFMPYYYGLKTEYCFAATATNDAGLVETPKQTLMSCDSVTPKITLTNYGTSTMTSATIVLSVDGTPQKTINWTGSLATYSSTVISNVKVGASSLGNHTILAVVSNPNGSADAVPANNNDTLAFTIFSNTGGAAIVETFENAFPETGWSIINVQNDPVTWIQTTPGGFGTSSKSTNLSFYNSPPANIDEIILAGQSFSTATGVTMKFDLAKSTYTGFADTLRVKVSSNCGQTWTTVYDKNDGVSGWSTAPDNTSTEFVPTSTQWRTETVNLNAYAGQANVVVMFEGISGYGNDVYVDNINFATTAAGIKEYNNIANINVFPNPASSSVGVQVSLSTSDNISIHIYNNLGQLVYSENKPDMPEGDNLISINTQNFNNGVYNMVVSGNQGHISRKISIIK